MSKVMIVDDEESIRRVLAMRLGSEDYEIVTHGDAVEALEAVDREHPDIVLMDINMPRMDGFEACRRLTTAHPELPVLFLSARGDVTDRIVGFEAGGRDYIPKPFSPAELIARIKAVLRDKNAREAAEEKARTYRVMAITDPLTGVANRRYFESRFKEEIARASRYGFVLSCAVIDGDGFKEINDAHGHAAGDRVLQAVADVLRNNVREVDIIARYGGDEFVILFPETDLARAGRSAERICRSVKSLIVDGVSSAVSVSIGVACGSDASLMTQADKALYRAKQRGGNCVASGPE